MRPNTNTRILNQPGWTLLELLVVLAMMGLLLTLVPPLFGNTLASIELKAGTRELATALKQTRAAAVSSREEHVLLLDLQGRTFHQARLRKRHTLPADTEVTITTAESEQIGERQAGIRFFPDGSSTGGRIELQRRNQRFTIDIHWLTGKVVIQS